jgi:ribonuclease HI
VAKLSDSKPETQGSNPCVPAKSCPRTMIFYTDGSTLNNGQFGRQVSRIVVTDGEGKLLIDHMIGDKTNNEAEAYAILAVLKRTQLNKLTGVQIRSDSDFWVKAVRGRWNLKQSRLFPVRDLLYKMFDETGAQLIWVPREQNPAGQYLEANPTGKEKGKKDPRKVPCPHCGKPIIVAYGKAKKDV